MSARTPPNNLVMNNHRSRSPLATRFDPSGLRHKNLGTSEHRGYSPGGSNNSPHTQNRGISDRIRTSKIPNNIHQHHHPHNNLQQQQFFHKQQPPLQENSYRRKQNRSKRQVEEGELSDEEEEITQVSEIVRANSKSKMSNRQPSFANGLSKNGSSQKGVIERAKAKGLEAQIEKMRAELIKKKSINQGLKNELENLEVVKGLSSPGQGSLLLEKDHLRSEIASLTKQLVKKNSKLREMENVHACLMEENRELDKKLNELKKEEPVYNKIIKEHEKVEEEYELLKNLMDEQEFIKQEQMFVTRMKLEESSQAHMDFHIRDLVEKMAINKSVAKEYLQKYINKLEDELSTLTQLVQN